MTVSAFEVACSQYFNFFKGVTAILVTNRMQPQARPCRYGMNGKMNGLELQNITLACLAATETVWR